VDVNGEDIAGVSNPLVEDNTDGSVDEVDKIVLDESAIVVPGESSTVLFCVDSVVYRDVALKNVTSVT